MRATAPALLFVATSAIATSCGGDDFCAQGSYECTSHPAAGSSGTGGSAGDTSLAGSTGVGGTADGGTAGSLASGGNSSGGSSVVGGAGGEAGDAGHGGTAGSAATGGTSGTGGMSGDAGEAGSGGSGPQQCDPLAPSPGCVLAPLAAIFVAPAANGGKNSNNGTQSAPVATIKHALMLAADDGLPIYICSGKYEEHVEVITDGLALHGGFTCDANIWTHNRTKRARITPATTGEALRVKDVTGLEVTDLEFVAKDATDPGASSVGVFVSGSEDVAFTRVHVVAGDGRDGVDGVLEPYAFSTRAELKGNDAIDDQGTDSKSCSCEGSGVLSLGGRGGSAGQNGGLGAPDLGGGEPGIFGNPCTIGGKGSDAPVASAGSGAITLGTVSTGWNPSAGLPGDDGTPGQGGGGGGGGETGSGGGGGGACGGCGGRGAGAGTGGGASIAILALNSKIALQSSTLETAQAGAGGGGATGQMGQLGGLGGLQTTGACPGGNGGDGGDGGGGGGGAGGISVGLVFASSTVTVDSMTTIVPGDPGQAGLGGGTNNSGIPGLAEKQLAL